MKSPTSQMLAVVRCGDSSLHESWARDTQHCDVAISYFGSDNERVFPEAKYVHHKKAGKWDGIYDFFQCNPEVVNIYPYFWFPDDDLNLSGNDIDRILSIGTKYNLDIFQPSLCMQSYFTHFITLHHPRNEVRFTNFVEIMSPVISNRLFQKVLPTMSNTRSGFGLDFLWAQMADDMRGGDQSGCGIIDAVSLHHTRPVGSALKGAMAQDGGRSGREEFSDVLKGVRKRHPFIRSLGLAVPRKRVFSVVTEGGETIRSPFVIIWRTLSLFAFGQRNTSQRIHRWRATLYSLTASF